jgi:hypothetical protein
LMLERALRCSFLVECSKLLANSSDGRPLTLLKLQAMQLTLLVFLYDSLHSNLLFKLPKLFSQFFLDLGALRYQFFRLLFRHFD